MSWYSDREPFDEYDPPYCKNCEGGDSKAQCDRCQARHEEEDFNDRMKDMLLERFFGMVVEA